MKTLFRNPFAQSKSPALRQVISRSWAERDSILEPNVNLFCWKRTSDPAIHAYLVGLSFGEVKPIRIPVSSNELSDQVKKARALWDQSSLTTSDSFWQDVTQLTGDFLSFSPYQSGTLHLKVVDNDACSKFHTDGYTLRLFTTYYGKGTEWLPEAAVNRHALGKTNDLIVKDTSQIESMDTFEVGILKGQSRRGAARTKGIVHRSPAIQQEGLKRVILRVDL